MDPTRINKLAFCIGAALGKLDRLREKPEMQDNPLLEQVRSLLVEATDQFYEQDAEDRKRGERL